MKKTFYSAALSLLGLALTSSPALAQDAQRAGHRSCSSMEALAAQIAADPARAQTLAAIDNQAMRYAAEHANTAQRSAATSAVTLTIPVVVHVLYNTTAQNISDAQIQSQIDVLNEDYQKLNADAANAPSLFAPLVANVNIAFTLAKRTPAGAATNGIIRKSTTRTSWPVDNPSTGAFYEYMKQTSQGGSDPWPASQYLNLWVCNMAGGILGYAQFPGGPAAYDGVVIQTAAFGRGGSAGAPFNLGRTATHEVGHWLNLYHIWGDDGTACTGSDQVSDTPNQADENYGTPAYPNPSCSNTSDMYMNYMDYVDDKAMYMFSTGQSSRMNALFATGGARVSLKTSLGGTPPSGGTCPTAAGLAASSITNTSATVSWGAATGATSYNLQYRVSGGAWTTVNQTATSKSLTGLTAGTTYEYQVQTVCSTGNAAYSAAASFLTTGGIIPPTYCTSKGTSVSYEYIDLVSLGSINRTSAADAGYYNGTALSTNLTAGVSNTISFSAGFAGTAYSEYFKVYIDYNKNGVFTDAGETVVSAAASSVATTRTASFTVPTSAKNGATRMRVVMSDNSATTSCGSYSYGETEDYTVNISGGTARLASAQTASNSYSLFPNPASSVLNIARPATATSSEAALSVRVYDLRGSEVRGLSFENGQLNVASLNKGTYLLTITDGASTSHQRFVKE
jgi:hypothetical protein